MQYNGMLIKMISDDISQIQGHLSIFYSHQVSKLVLLSGFYILGEDSSLEHNKSFHISDEGEVSVRSDGSS